MSLLATLFTGNVAQPIEAVGNVLDKLFTSDEEKLDKQALIQKLYQRPHEVQAEINKVEAQHRSVFVAGWRPFIGWVCGSGLAFAFLVNPVIQWHTGAPGPDIPFEFMSELVFALLGLGALRTTEEFRFLEGRYLPKACIRSRIVQIFLDIEADFLQNQGKRFNVCCSVRGTMLSR